MKIHPSSLRASIGLIGCLIVLGARCAGSGGGEALVSTANGLAGNWSYLVTNAYDATFTDCTQDAAILENQTYYEGSGLAPLCTPASYFDVVQEDESFEIVPHSVNCTDGGAAMISGSGTVVNGNLSGEWRSVRAGGAESRGQFHGEVVGGHLVLVDAGREFHGDFEGGCSLSPGLSASVVVD